MKIGGQKGGSFNLCDVPDIIESMVKMSEFLRRLVVDHLCPTTESRCLLKALKVLVGGHGQLTHEDAMQLEDESFRRQRHGAEEEMCKYAIQQARMRMREQWLRNGSS